MVIMLLTNEARFRVTFFMKIKKSNSFRGNHLVKLLFLGAYRSLISISKAFAMHPIIKNASKHTCQKQQLEQDIVDIINHYKEIIVEIYSKINEILNKKEISYDLEIIKNKIQNAEEKKEKINELNRLLIDELIEDIVLKMLLEKRYLWVEIQIQTVL